EPFENRFTVTVGVAEQSRPYNGQRRSRRDQTEDGEPEAPSGITLPNIIPVYQQAALPTDGEPHPRALWSDQDPPFDRNTALRIRTSSSREDSQGQAEDIYDFFINMDNIYLKTELKVAAAEEVDILRARFKYGMVLVGLALLYQHSQDVKYAQSETDEEI